MSMIRILWLCVNEDLVGRVEMGLQEIRADLV